MTFDIKAFFFSSTSDWKKRLAEECRKLVYDRIGEDETYEMWRGGKLGVNSTAVCYEHKLCKKWEDDVKETEAEKKAAKEAKASEKKKAKEAKKKAKEAKAKAAPVAKKISLEAYMAKKSVYLGKEEKYYTKSRSFEEWDKAMQEFTDSWSKKKEGAEEDEAKTEL